MKYFIQSYADIGYDYGTFSSIEEIEGHINAYGYELVRVTSHGTYSTTYWVNEQPSL